MRIKINVSLAAQHGGNAFGYSPGDVVEWKDVADAMRLIERGFASPVDPVPEKPGKQVERR